MSAPASPPTFNLKAVVLETGIKPHTLRAWENRYGLPHPQRTEGNHRIYTQTDIDIVKWLMARREEGLTIGRAVELWHKLAEQGEDPLTVAAYYTGDLPATYPVGEALETIRRKWIDSCLKFDKAAAENALTQALVLYPIPMVCREILQKGMVHIGRLWFQNKATVQQEHFYSALLVERLSALLSVAPAPNRGGRILVACPPREEHTIVLLLLSLLLRYQGWEIVYLGANVPVIQLESAIEIVKPELVILAAQRLQTAASLARVTQLLQDKGVNAAFGGSIFNLIPALSQRIYGHFLGKSIDEAMAVISQIMAFNPPPSKVEPRSELYESASNHYQAKRHLIEFDTIQTLKDEKFPLQHLNETNSRYARNILAALDLGKMNFITFELKLTRQLMDNYGISWNWQLMYVDAYFKAVQKNLAGEGIPIIEWLEQVRSDLRTQIQ